jgi:hypothetical protein
MVAETKRCSAAKQFHLQCAERIAEHLLFRALLPEPAQQTLPEMDYRLYGELHGRRGY